MNSHVIGNQIMAMFHGSTFFPKNEFLYPFVELSTLIFQAIHISRKYGIFDLLHIEPNISRYNTCIAGFVNDIEMLFFQCIFQ